MLLKKNLQKSREFHHLQYTISSARIVACKDKIKLDGTVNKFIG